MLLSVYGLLKEPNPDSALDGLAARLCKHDYPEFVRQAREWTEKEAMGATL